MDQDTHAALVAHGQGITFLSLQVSLIGFAIEALIATHPNRAEVRRVFDQMLGQFQTQPTWLSLSADDSKLARVMVEKMFSDTPGSQ